MSYGASTLDQSDTSSTGSGFAIKSSTDNYAIGMSFTCGTTGKLDYAIFQLTGAGSVSGTVTCTLYADDGSSPTGSALSTSTGVTIVAAWSSTDVTFQFPDDYQMTAGTKYWLVLSVDYAESSSNYIQAAVANADNYASGNRNRMDSLSAWKDDQGTNDMYFKEYILPYTADAAFIFNLI